LVAAVVMVAAAGCSSGAGSYPSATPAPSTSIPTSIPSSTPASAPTTVPGLRITRSAAPAGYEKLTTEWLRVQRVRGVAQDIAVFRPKGAGPFPAVVYLHGSSGLEHVELAWARSLVDAGFIVVAGCYLAAVPGATASAFVTCPSAPHSDGNDLAGARPTAQALLDTAASLPGVEPGRIGVVGVSLGGLLALTYPDPRVKAIVADSGYGKGPAAAGDAPVLLIGWTDDAHVAHDRVVGYERNRRAAGKPVESHYYAGEGHVATLARSIVAIDATKRTVAFLRSHLR
jgi:dienelactone hydrolase